MVSTRTPGWSMPEPAMQRSPWRGVPRHTRRGSPPRARARQVPVRRWLCASRPAPPCGPGEANDGGHGRETRRLPSSPTEDCAAGKGANSGHSRTDQARPRCPAAIRMSIVLRAARRRTNECPLCPSAPTRTPAIHGFRGTEWGYDPGRARTGWPPSRRDRESGIWSRAERPFPLRDGPPL
jgi:hypothetical protein